MLEGGGFAKRRAGARRFRIEILNFLKGLHGGSHPRCRGSWGHQRALHVAGGQTIVTGMAGRYANALFELALEAKALDRVMSELDTFAALLDESADLRRLVRSPVFSAGEQARALAAILKRAEISGLTANFLGLVTRNRRLFAVREMIEDYKALAAAHRGETTAEVTSAEALDEEEMKALKTAIKEAMGTDVVIAAKVDERLIGGLIVKVGSRQIDTSLRGKLNNLQIALKEVG